MLSSGGFGSLLIMGAIDFIPELLTVGTAVSSVFGFYFDRIRKNIERDEPAQMDRVATAAVAEADLKAAEAPLSVHEENGQLTVSREDLQKLLDEAAQAAAGTVVTAMKGELSAERRKDRRAGFRSGMAFFIAGIFASAAITLYVHPLK